MGVITNIKNGELPLSLLMKREASAYHNSWKEPLN